MRIKGTKLLKVLAYLNIIVNIGLVFAIYKFTDGSFAITYLSALGLAIIIFINHHFISKKYNKLINENVLKGLLKRYNFEIYPDRSIDQKVIQGTGMLPLGNVYKSSNFLTGTYNGINIVQSDLVIKDVNYFMLLIQAIFTKTAGLYIEDIFIGRWYIFDFSKNINDNLQVRDKEFLHAVLDTSKTNKNYSRVEMESLRFNSKFLVYAQNPNEAFYVLTPKIMENMLRLRESIDGKLMFCFIRKKLHIAVSKPKNIFKHSVFKKLDYNSLSNDAYNNMSIILDFIKKLKLDNDIFK